MKVSIRSESSEIRKTKTKANIKGIKNGPKIKIDQYFFVEIEKENHIKIARGVVN